MKRGWEGLRWRGSGRHEVEGKESFWAQLTYVNTGMNIHLIMVFHSAVTEEGQLSLPMAARSTRERQAWRWRVQPQGGGTATAPSAALHAPPPAEPGPRRAALVCTMAYNAHSLDSFICYYLYLGFRTLYLYLDDPEDESVEIARRYPSERVVVRVRDKRLLREWRTLPSWKAVRRPLTLRPHRHSRASSRAAGGAATRARVSVATRRVPLPPFSRARLACARSHGARRLASVASPALAHTAFAHARRARRLARSSSCTPQTRCRRASCSTASMRSPRAASVAMSGSYTSTRMSSSTSQTA
jgi:hypothetical protein